MMNGIYGIDNCVAPSGLDVVGNMYVPRPSARAIMPCACSASKSNQVYLSGYPHSSFNAEKIDKSYNMKGLI